MATAAAAAAARARRDIQHHFFMNDAVRPERAVAFEPSRMSQERQFERMRARGIICEADPGRYWLDVVAYDVDLTGRHRRLKVALAIALAALAVGLLIAIIPLPALLGS